MIYKKLQKIILISQLNPDKSLLPDLTALLKNKIVSKEFFSELKNPSWIPFLIENKLIRPPKGKTDDSSELPVLNYLLRIAASSEDYHRDVSRAIKVISRSVNNVRKMSQILDILLLLAPQESKAYLNKLVKLIANGKWFLGGENVVQLASRLADAKMKKESLLLVKALLAISPKSSSNDYSKESYLREWDYGKVLKVFTKEIAPKYPLDSLKLVSHLLSLTLSRGSKKKIVPNDYSYIWRPAIEDHEQNSTSQIKSVLVVAVRDISEFMLLKPEAGLAEWITVRDLLLANKWNVFRRVWIHLLRLSGKKCINLVEEELNKKSLFTTTDYVHEYYWLLNQQYGNVSVKTQQKILSWISEGRGKSEIISIEESYQSWHKKVMPDNILEKYVKYWEFEKLEPISKYLTGEWKVKYQNLLNKFKKTSHPDFAVYSGSSDMQEVAPELIKNKFENINLNDLLDNFKSNMVVDQDQADIGHLLRQYVDGLEGKDKNISWPSVMEIGQYLLKRRLASYVIYKNDIDVTKDWSWPTKCLVDLINRGIQKNDIDLRFAESTLTLLESLVRDIDPVPTRVKPNSNRSDEWTIEAINSIRGKALETVIQFALWQIRQVKTDEFNRKDAGFDYSPLFVRVRKVLDDHLNLSIDKSPAIRSVYGHWLPWLVLIDRKWVRQNINEIFSTTNKELFMAAFSAYLLYRDPYNSVFSVAKDAYYRAINLVYHKLPNSQRLTDQNHLETRFAQHLMVYYWNGQVKMDDKLLKQFYLKSSDIGKAEAMRFIGTILDEGVVTTEGIKRAKVLVDQRIKSKNMVELREFGYWYASKSLSNDVWVLKKLKSILKITHWVEPDYKVFEKMEKDVVSSPKLVMVCLREMVKVGDRDSRAGYDLRRDVLENILKVGLSNDGEVHELTVKVINKLLERGIVDYLDLLKDEK